MKPFVYLNKLTREQVEAILSKATSDDDFFHRQMQDFDVFISLEEIEYYSYDGELQCCTYNIRYGVASDDAYFLIPFIKKFNLEVCDIDLINDDEEIWDSPLHDGYTSMGRPFEGIQQRNPQRYHSSYKFPYKGKDTRNTLELIEDWIRDKYEIDDPE